MIFCTIQGEKWKTSFSHTFCDKKINNMLFYSCFMPSLQHNPVGRCHIAYLLSVKRLIFQTSVILNSNKSSFVLKQAAGWRPLSWLGNIKPFNCCFLGEFILFCQPVLGKTFLLRCLQGKIKSEYIK